MNIHEYQAKEILKRFGIRVPVGHVIHNSGEAKETVKNISSKTNSWAVKAQILAGGRGKAGGIKVAYSAEEVEMYASELIGSTLITDQTSSEGLKINHVLIEENIYYPGESEIKEYYISFLLNRNSGKNMVIYSPNGGIEIESLSEKAPELIYKEEIDPIKGLQKSQIKNITEHIGIEGTDLNNMTRFLLSLYKAFIETDSLLLEINPVIKTTDNLLIAADVKMILDDNAQFRHPECSSLYNMPTEVPNDEEAKKANLNFIKLNGDISCMVNGAGLAMATMDMIKLAGKNPANFLDVGGNANAKTIENGFRLIIKDPDTRAVFINIFGGIVRCDRVAQGIMNAYNKTGEINIPIILRLQGTNSREAKHIINKSELTIIPVETLADAMDIIKGIDS